MTAECLYYTSLAHYKLGELRAARLVAERMLRRNPDDANALALHTLVRDKVFREGLNGIALAVLVALAAGVAGSLARR